jgi:ABC-2 type transport system ATP-binding protein
VFGLLGPNGAGKTTIISMLTGVLEPTAGTARISGYNIHTNREEAKKVNGLVPQGLALYPNLSARASLALMHVPMVCEAKSSKSMCMTCCAWSL